jgi:hypothetical protein
MRRHPPTILLITCRQELLASPLVLLLAQSLSGAYPLLRTAADAILEAVEGYVG